MATKELLMLWLTAATKAMMVFPPPLVPVFVSIRLPSRFIVPPFKVRLLLGKAVVPDILIFPLTVSVVPATLMI